MEADNNKPNKSDNTYHYDQPVSSPKTMWLTKLEEIVRGNKKFTAINISINSRNIISLPISALVLLAAVILCVLLYKNDVLSMSGIKSLATADGLSFKPDDTSGNTQKTFVIGGQQFTENEKNIALNGIALDDISVFGNFKSLENLNLDDNDISDIYALADLAQLTVLKLNDNDITDIAPLGNLNSIRHLELNNNQISDISGLAGLGALESLSLSGNQIADISPLKELYNLQALALSENSLNDISALSDLQNLTELYLDKTQITDISPLYGLKNLTVLYIRGNNIPSEQISKFKVMNPGCLVLSNGVSASGISLDYTSIYLYKGAYWTLNASVSPSDAAGTVIWQSSDDSIVEVDQTGRIYCKELGKNATITATVDGVSASCIVYVSYEYKSSDNKDTIPVENAEANDSVLKGLSASEIYIFVGSSKEITAVVTSGSVTWSTSDESITILTVDSENPNKVHIKGDNAGDAVVKAVLGNTEINCKVHVSWP